MLINLLVKLKYLFLILFLISSFLTSCEKDLSPLYTPTPSIEPVQQPSFTSVISGRVLLENQSEHSNCLVYMDSLDMGTGTDSSGYYTLFFNESDTIYTGIFKIYYFLYDYDLDSAQIKLVNGKVQLDTLDVDSTGMLSLKEMEQILLIDGFTDRQEYRIGDTLIFTARFTNLTQKDTIHIFIPSIFSQLGHVTIARNDSFDYFLSPGYIITDLDLNLYLFPGGIWTGTEAWTVPKGQRVGGIFHPLVPDEYIVLHSYQIKAHRISKQMKDFIFNDWDDLHRGKDPQGYAPNKNRLPHIFIIE